MAYIPPHKRRGTPSEPASRDDRKHGDLGILCSSFNRICCINLDKRVDKWRQMQSEAKKIGYRWHDKLERIAAVDGHAILENELLDTREIRREYPDDANRNLSAGEIGCALSHITLWRQLAESPGTESTMLILEDDCIFAHSKGRSRFARACVTAIEQLPEDWSFFYLGLSARGTRTYLNDVNNENVQATIDPMDPPILIYRPEYGYHTHAYALRKEAAGILLNHLPIQGPIDVWLAENKWFDLPVYCAVIANEGWILSDGTREGRDLVTQRRGPNIVTDIKRS